MKNKKLLKEKLSGGKTILGTWCELPSPELINVLSRAGLDFVIIDMEHSSMDFRVAGQMVIASEVEGTSSLVRVPKNDESSILRALELKPDGVLVPHIDNAADRKKVILAAKFPSVGNRSLNPFVRSGGYKSDPEFTKRENDRIVTGILIESLAGIKNARSIIADDNLDLVYLGSYDLSVAFDCPGDTKNPKVISALSKLSKIITRQGKAVSTMFHDREELFFYKKLGIQVLCYKVDTSIVFDEVTQIKKLL